MAIGVVITKYLTPETCDIRGRSRPLEALGLGKAHRAELEEAEREAENRALRG
jgi:hypothetical protein